MEFDSESGGVWNMALSVEVCRKWFGGVGKCHPPF